MTVDDAIAVVNLVLTDFFDGCAGDCMLPGGSPLFRLNANGEIEQLVDGEWIPPQGDYELPPTPARTEPTPEERRCLAAANAAAVLEQLYEELSDAFQEGMTFQQWTEFLTALLITLLGTIFGLVIAPLVAIGVLIVGVIYEVMEFVTADVWTSEFTEMLKCLLYECSYDAGDDVVKFDYPCFLNNLASVTDIFDPTFAQIRLFGQIAYIMQILGAQSLDAMGATTGVEVADCEDCNAPWCRLYDFTEDPFLFEPQLSGATPLADWTIGVGFESIYINAGNGYTIMAIASPFAATIQAIEIGFTWTDGSYAATGDSNLIASQSFTNIFHSSAIGTTETSPITWCYDETDPPAPVTVTQLQMQFFPGSTLDGSDPGGQMTLQYMKVMGTGNPPALGEECEWEDCAL